MVPIPLAVMIGGLVIAVLCFWAAHVARKESKEAYNEGYSEGYIDGLAAGSGDKVAYSEIDERGLVHVITRKKKEE